VFRVSLVCMGKLNPDQIKAALPAVKRWKKKGASITRTYEFKDFVGAMDFVKKVARAAEKAQHHPDIDIRWNKVTLTLATHSEGGLTQKDFDLAKKIDPMAAD
jgi:4a-hydroxytetrahydrobiopterin dehydratase